jgi:hypothetical protein
LAASASTVVDETAFPVTPPNGDKSSKILRRKIDGVVSTFQKTLANIDVLTGRVPTRR